MESEGKRKGSAFLIELPCAKRGSLKGKPIDKREKKRI